MAYKSILDRIDYLEFPTILWSEDYDKDPELLNMLVQHISDFMLFNSNVPFDDAKNPSVNIDIFEGNTQSGDLREEFEGLLYTYGEEGPAELNDYKFHRTAFESIEGTLIGMPLKFTMHNVSQAFTDKQLTKMSEKAAAYIRNAAIDAMMQQTGENLEDLKDPDAEAPSTMEELLEELNGSQQLEWVATRLLLNLSRRYNTEDELRKANKDHYVRNCMFAHVDTEGATPQLKYVSPDQVKFISPVAVEDMDDPNIIAWSINNYISLENALRKYGQDLAEQKSLQDIIDIVVRLRQNSNINGAYDPTRLATTYLTEQVQGDHGYSVTIPFESTFFPTSDLTNHNGVCAILEQKIYFKVIKQKKFIVKVNGKNPTAQERKRMKFGITVEGITYKRVDDKYKARPGEYLIKKPYEEMWEATRLAHNTIIRVGPYKYQTRYEKDQNRVFPPVIGLVSHTESLVSVSKSFWKMYNSFMYKADELTKLTGSEDVLMIDKAQSNGDVKSMLYNARKAGFVEFDSTLIQDRENPLAKMHMNKVSFSPSAKSVMNYLEAADAIKRMWGDIVGINAHSLGQASPYDSNGKVNTLIQQASLIMRRYYYEDYTFRKRAYQRYTDIVKKFFGSKNQNISIYWGPQEKEILRVTKDLSTYDMEVYLDMGTKSMEDKAFLENMASMALSAGAMDVATMAEIRLNENPTEALSIIKSTAKKMEEMQNQRAQQQQQILQEKNQIDKAAKVDVPLQRTQIQSETDKFIAELKEQSKRASDNFKGEMYDIKEANDRQKTLLNAEADLEKQSQLQEEQAIINESQQQAPPPM